MKRRSTETAFGFLASILLAFEAGAAPRPGDLLVTDSRNGRVLRVVPGSGFVEVLSPRPGQTNHLQRPTGIAVSRSHRSIYVIDAEDGQLVRINPDTGAQAVQQQQSVHPTVPGEPLQFPGAIRGLEIPPPAPDAFGDQVLVIGSQGVHRSTAQRRGGWSAPELLTAPDFPAVPTGSALDRYGDPLRLWVATGGTTLQEATEQGGGLALTQAALFPTQTVVDVDVLPSGRSAMLVRTLSSPTMCSFATVYSLASEPLASEELLRCPTAVALGARGELYVADVASTEGGEARIVAVVDGVEEIFASLPPGADPLTLPADIEVVPGEATFEWIEQGPTHSLASGVSDDGEVVIGGDFAGMWWRWTPATGRETIGIGNPLGTSADGSVVLLSASSPGGIAPFTWRPGSGATPVPAVPSVESWYVNGISGDGRVLVGDALTQQMAQVAIRWRSGVPALLPNLEGASGCRALRASRDGSVAAGICSGAFEPEATLWDAHGLLTRLHEGSLLLPDESYPMGISADGRVVVGDARIGSSWFAFRWTAAEGVVPLATPGVDPPTVALGVSRDGGRVLVLAPGEGPRLWDVELGLRDLWTELVDVYGLDVDRAMLADTNLLSGDGRTLVGQPDTEERDVWRIRLVPEPTGAVSSLPALAALASLVRRRPRTGRRASAPPS